MGKRRPLERAPEHCRPPADAVTVAEFRRSLQPGQRVVRAAGGSTVARAVGLALQLLQLRDCAEGIRAPVREVVQGALCVGPRQLAAVAACWPVEHAGELVVLWRVRDVGVQRREHLPCLPVRALAGEARVAEALELAEDDLVALGQDTLLRHAPRLLGVRALLEGCRRAERGARSGP